MTTNDDLMRELGALTANMQAVKERSEADTRNARESRAVIHEKLDQAVAVHLETTEKIGEIAVQVATTTLVAIQARDQSQAALENIHRFEREFREVQLPIITAAQAFTIEAEPVLGAMRAVQAIVIGFLGLGVLTLGGFVGMAFWARSQLAMIIRWAVGL